MVMNGRRLIINQTDNAIRISCDRLENIQYNEIVIMKVYDRLLPYLLTIYKKYSSLITTRGIQKLFEADPCGFLESFLDEYVSEDSFKLKKK